MQLIWLAFFSNGFQRKTRSLAVKFTRKQMTMENDEKTKDGEGH